MGIFIKLLIDGKENYRLIDEGNIDNCLGVNIKFYKDRMHEIRQLFLIKHVVDELNLEEINSEKRLTLVVKLLVCKDLKGKLRAKR